ncbi:MAG: glycosyltransferase, partial [Acidithiobacillus sp.]|nr:glycosyltransferase [Acidithiobacillus sp.]
MRVLYAIWNSLNGVPNGASLRPMAISQALRRLGHDLSIFSFAENPSCGIMADREKPAGFLRRPVRFMTDDDWKALRAQAELVQPDLLLLSHPPCTDFVSYSVVRKIPTIIVSSNFEMGFQIMRSVKRSLLNHAVLGLGEMVYLRRASRVWAISEDDRLRYQTWYRLNNVATIPNALPDPGAPCLDQGPPGHCGPDEPWVLFVGAFGYYPNQ